MNINFRAIVMSLLVIFIATSCDPEDGRTVWTGSYVEFDEASSSASYLRVNDSQNVTDELQINLVAAPSSSAITVNVEVDAESTTAVAGVHYVEVSGGSVAVAANSNFAYVPIEIIDDNVEPGDEWVLAYKITGSDTEIGPKAVTKHSFKISCELSADKMPGSWVLDMQDSYGDGWNGASITVEIDGVGTDYTVAGSANTETVVVPAGTTSLDFIFNSGDWDSEITFTIAAPNSAVVGSYGPNPPIGSLEIDACLL